jgi:hypothetical protein
MPAKLIMLGVLIGASAFSFSVSPAAAQRLLSPEEAKAVAIKVLQADASEVSGVIVNNTPHTIREIEVLIQYHWLWTNEFKPGLESPGRVASLKLDKDLLPGESTPFRYVPNPPLPGRQDGRFEPEVVVAGFTIVIPPTTASR